MPIVDLDFEEEMKETNFPDLLSDVPTTTDRNLLPEHPRRKKSTSRKEEKAKIKSDDKRVRGERTKEQRTTTEKKSIKADVSTIPTQNQNKHNTSLIVNASNSKNHTVTRLAIDPPISPTSHTTGTSSTKNETKSKHSSSSNGTPTKLTSENLQKLATPSLDPIATNTIVVSDSNDAKAGNAAPTKSRPKELSKLPLKNTKRDFIEQVSYAPTTITTAKKSSLVVQPTTESVSPLSPKGTTLSNTNSKVAPVSPKGTFASNVYAKPSIPLSPVGQVASPTKETTGTSKKEYSPKPHEVDLERVDSQGSIISSIHHESDEEDDNSKNGKDDTMMKLKNPDEAQDLLERARDRIARQRLVEQVKALEMIVERKNIELEQLNSQLRRAVETKSELVIAHNEIEKRHAAVVEKKEQNLLRMKQANIWLLEAQSIKEKELLNEIIRLTDMTRDNETKRREELDDWERMHRNEMLEKDYMIAQLLEELRKLGVNIESPIFTQQLRNNNKNYHHDNAHQSSFMFDPTSIISGASKYFFH